QFSKPFNLSCQLALDKFFANLQAEWFVKTQAYLDNTPGSIIVWTCQQQAGTANPPAQNDDAHSLFTQFSQQSGWQIDITAQENTCQRCNRHRTNAFAIFTKNNGTGFQFKCNTTTIHKQAGHIVFPFSDDTKMLCRKCAGLPVTTWLHARIKAEDMQ